MSLLKNLKFSLLIILVLMVLVIIRNLDRDVFKEQADSAVKVTQYDNNLITPEKLKELTTPYLVVELGHESIRDSIQLQSIIHIPFDRLLDKVNREILDKTEGALILFSGDIATSSKAWIILNQLGYKGVMILTAEENPGELKYKFQPDTSARLEQDTL